MSKPSLQMKWKDELWEQSHHRISLSLSLSPYILAAAAFPRGELHVRLVFNHSSRHILYLSLPRAPTVLTYKANNHHAGEKQRNSLAVSRKAQEEVSEQQMLYFQIFHSIKNEKQQSNRAQLQMEFHNAEEMS
jgi:hypothetical protein